MKNLFLASILLLAGCGGPPPAAEIDVPFTAQAPEGDWSQPWQDACEETSIYMVASFYADDAIRREEATARIRQILAAKEETFSPSKDESLETIAGIIEELDVPWRAELKENPTADDLKAELAAGRPVIVPVYAPELENPHYGTYGPRYHVLVLTGYDDAAGEFIVNDPGTKSGDGLRFPQQRFLDAIHDLNPADKAAGRKAVLFTRQTGWEAWFDGPTP